MKTHDSILAAKYIIALGCNQGNCLNVTQVQKILYIANGIALAKYDVPLVLEAPKAWPFGPVFPRTQKQINYNAEYNIEDSDFDSIKEDVDADKVLKYVVMKFGNTSAGRLSNWSHAKGGPWDKTTKEDGFKWNNPISLEVIKEYFSKFDFPDLELQSN